MPVSVCSGNRRITVSGKFLIASIKFSGVIPKKFKIRTMTKTATAVLTAVFSIPTKALKTIQETINAAIKIIISVGIIEGFVNLN